MVEEPRQQKEIAQFYLLLDNRGTTIRAKFNACRGTIPTGVFNMSEYINVLEVSDTNIPQLHNLVNCATVKICQAKFEQSKTLFSEGLTYAIIFLSLPTPRRIGGDSMESTIGSFLLSLGAGVLANLLTIWWQNHNKQK